MFGYLESGVICIRDGFAPFVGSAFAGDFDGDMAKAAILGCAVPVLDIGWDSNDVAGLETAGGLTLFLIPAFAVGTEKDLAAAGGRMMNMPVIATTRLEGDVDDIDGLD